MTAAGTYTLTHLDTNSGFLRGSAYLISDNGVVAGVVNSDELEATAGLMPLQ